MSKEIENLKLIRQEIVSKCSCIVEEEQIFCSKIDSDGKHCKVYAFPSSKWRIGDCPMADDDLRTKTPEQIKAKVRLGQQKQKKHK